MEKGDRRLHFFNIMLSFHYALAGSFCFSAFWAIPSPISFSSSSILFAFPRKLHHPVFRFARKAFHLANHLQQGEEVVAYAIGIIGQEFLQPGTERRHLFTVCLGAVSLIN